MRITQPLNTTRTTTAELSVGELLVTRGLITDEQRRNALATQAQTGSRLGTILIASGAVHPRDLYRALADAWGAEYLDVSRSELDETILPRVDPGQLIRESWIPLFRDPDGTIAVATAERPTETLHDHIELTLGEPVRLVVSSDWSVSKAIQLGYRDAVVDRATEQLWRDHPEASARVVLDRRQQIVGGLTLVSVIALIVLFPTATLSVLSLLLATGFLVGIAFKFVVCMTGARKEFEQTVTAAEVAALTDEELPIYTVLVPCYRESEIIGQLVTNLGRLDYPSDKLEILLLLEADDDETLAAAKASNPDHTITFVIIPDGQPKTKPKACNVGLFLAKGDFLVIYDAEDRPDADQLKRAVIGFRKARRGTVCLQAALNYFNAGENALTRMFTLEYSFWFDYMLPGLDARRLPIPLGGTSNHFRTDALRELGGWDPYNVTEDADLGIRVAARGQRVGVIDSTTFEEANRAYGNWVRQRSRWIKGYMQTTLVHTRHPIRLVQQAGLMQALGFGMLIGGTAVSFLAVIPLYLVFLVSLCLPAAEVGKYFPGWVLWFSLTNLLLGNGLMIWVSMMGAFRRRRYSLVLWALLNPLYWLMHSVAAYKALWQLATRPHYWEKTAHGLTHEDTDVPAPGDHTEREWNEPRVAGPVVAR
ncbi:MAG: group 2 family glycosyl transferase [Frankiales bacterium]|nr:group 2 family glycosyl transferase [Frankiales bacterium]